MIRTTFIEISSLRYFITRIFTQYLQAGIIHQYFIHLYPVFNICEIIQKYIFNTFLYAYVYSLQSLAFYSENDRLLNAVFLY